jgi:hypothetical protein
MNSAVAGPGSATINHAREQECREDGQHMVKHGVDYRRRAHG